MACFQSSYTDYETNANNPVESNVYDARGLRTAQIDRTGRITSFRYDDSGRLTRTYSPGANDDPAHSETWTDDDNLFTETHYDTVLCIK